MKLWLFLSYKSLFSTTIFDLNCHIEVQEFLQPKTFLVGHLYHHRLIYTPCIRPKTEVASNRRRETREDTRRSSLKI